MWERLACVASVSVLFPSKARTARKMARVSGEWVLFLARPKPRISFLGLSLLRNSKETLATQARERPAEFNSLIKCLSRARVEH